jgi:hypothetical protein
MPKLSAGNDDRAIVVATFCWMTVRSRPRRPPIREKDPPFVRGWRLTSDFTGAPGGQGSLSKSAGSRPGRVTTLGGLTNGWAADAASPFASYEHVVAHALGSNGANLCLSSPGRRRQDHHRAVAEHIMVAIEKHGLALGERAELGADVRIDRVCRRRVREHRGALGPLHEPG